MSDAKVIPFRVLRSREEEQRRDAIVAAAVELIREYDRRSKTYQHISLASLRPLRDAVKGGQP